MAWHQKADRSNGLTLSIAVETCFMFSAKVRQDVYNATLVDLRAVPGYENVYQEEEDEESAAG
jgi:hypothetical protein